jgi:tetratricopeptide (TPR) repeat protein
MYISLINLLIVEGNFPQAVLVGEEGLALFPKAENILYLIGMAEDLRGNHTRAEQHFRRAIDMSPDSEQGYNNLGTSLDKQRRWEEAAAAYRKAVQINPLYAIGHYNLGIALYNLKRPAEAVEELSVAYRLGGGADALYSLTALQAELGDRASAEKSLQALEEIDDARAKILRKELNW